MDLDRFERLTTTVGGRMTRRKALAATVAGLSAFGLAHPASELAAQDATPDADERAPAFLFVQLAEGGTWTPSPDEEGVYILSLLGSSSQTLFFSDRPARIVGTVDTDKFLEGLGFTPANPPNAALVVKTPEGGRDVLVIELSDPIYNEGDSPQVTYQARVLEAYTGEGLASWSAEQQDDLLPERFTDASLFIDDCPDANPLVCYDANCDQVGDLGNQGMCWSWSAFQCQPCNGGFDGTSAQCDANFSGCNGQCTTRIDCQIL